MRSIASREACDVQADNLAGLVWFGYTELTQVGHPPEHYLYVRPRDPELLGQSAYATNDEIVAEVHDEVVVTQELNGDEQCVREPQRRLLPEVGDLKPERRAVSHRIDGRGRGISNHRANLGDAGVPDSFETVEQDGLVPHWEQLLRRRIRDRP
jgi:hypothetical protein